MATKAIDAPATRKNGRIAARRIRKIFGNIHEISEMPNLIEVQRESYEQFLRSDPATGYVSGLEKTLRSVFPIVDFAGTAHLDFDHYELEDPKYDTDECRQRGLTYAAPMRVTLRLTTFEIDPETEAKSVIDIKEQDVYMGDMPLMTMNGTFIINGTERVIVSQMHRSPGVLFDHDRGKTHASGKYLFAARVIPYRGSWLDFEFDAKDIVNVRIDRKRKLPVTSLLYALGMSGEEILNRFDATLGYAAAENVLLFCEAALIQVPNRREDDLPFLAGVQFPATPFADRVSLEAEFLSSRTVKAGAGTEDKPVLLNAYGRKRLWKRLNIELGLFSDAGRAVGRAVADLCNFLNPAAVIVGGDLSLAGDALLDGVREEIDRCSLPGIAEAVEVRGGVLGDRAEVLGALAVVIADTARLRSAGLAPIGAGRG